MSQMTHNIFVILPYSYCRVSDVYDGVFCAVLFPTDVLDEILNLIESVSEDFPSYSYIYLFKVGMAKILISM